MGFKFPLHFGHFLFPPNITLIPLPKSQSLQIGPHFKQIYQGSIAPENTFFFLLQLEQYVAIANIFIKVNFGYFSIKLNKPHLYLAIHFNHLVHSIHYIQTT